MPKVIAAIAPPRRERPAEPGVCLVRARAELVSLGGAVLLALCVLISAILFLVLTVPGATASQRVIAVILFVACWLYFVNGITEELSLVDHTLVYRSALGRSRRIPLSELEAMILRHEGFNLERGMETIEFRQTGRKPDRVSLGPCWQRHKLEEFLASVEQALQQ
ncbi:hypothetical protein HY479_04035 [Candidatus Uhrbacteria bacterium]|nr:hypothetical protein [Candidatus Uhrbacteria bacterium]